MEKQTLEYFDWDDVEKYICDKLGIVPAQFRDYPIVVGGDYKDLWHVWLTINFEEIRNGSYTKTWLDDIDRIFERLIKEYGEWVECLRPILNDMREEFGDELMIHYSW